MAYKCHSGSGYSFNETLNHAHIYAHLFIGFGTIPCFVFHWGRW